MLLFEALFYLFFLKESKKRLLISFEGRMKMEHVEQMIFFLLLED